jgi:pimeloyl-ACP methyl ester carboxylesterase
VNLARSWGRLLGVLTAVGAVLGTMVATAPAALAGPPPATADARLTAFSDQRPTWAPCDTGGLGAQLECATITVPLDYRHPDGDRLSLAISRHRATDPAHRRGVLLLNPGGPGGSGLLLPAVFLDRDIAKGYDLIGFDPRGVGRSSPLVCEVTPELATPNTRPADAEFAAWAADAQAAEQGCDRAGGGIRPFINTPNTARDMDVIRGVLGEKKINYLGFSYGTYLGAVYGSLFGRNLDRNVLDSSVHPEWIWRPQFEEQAIAIGSNVDEWAAWTGQRNKAFGLGASAQQVLGTVEDLAAKLAAKPVGDFDRSTLDLVIGQGARYRPLWAVLGQLLDEVRAAVSGQQTAAGADAVAAGRLLANLGIAEVREGVFDTVTCEADWPRDLQTYYADMRLFRERYPYGFGVVRAAPTTCTFRSFTPPDRITDLRRDGYPVGLVIQAEGDAQTRYDGGPAMAYRLRDNLVSVSDDGTHGLYGRNTCATAIVDRYLLDGVLPGSRSVCPGDPRPPIPSDTAPAQVQPHAAAALEATVRQFIAAKHLDRH